MRARSMALVAAAAVAVVLAPSLARACAVCGQGAADRSNLAFLISTIFLSLLPLAAIFGGLAWLARHARAVMAEEFVDRDVLPRAAGEPEPPLADAASGEPTPA